MSDRVFVGDNVLLTLATYKNLSTFTDLRVKWQNPYGTKGYWTAVIHPSINTKIQSNITFDTSGTWKVQAFASKVGYKYHGYWAEIRVYEPVAPDTTTLPVTTVPTT
jgi:hypothetical protein